MLVRSRHMFRHRIQLLACFFRVFGVVTAFPSLGTCVVLDGQSVDWHLCKYGAGGAGGKERKGAGSLNA